MNAEIPREAKWFVEQTARNGEITDAIRQLLLKKANAKRLVPREPLDFIRLDRALALRPLESADFWHRHGRLYVRYVERPRASSVRVTE